MADTVLGNLVWRITGDNKDFNKKIKTSKKSAGGFGKSLLKMGKIAAAAFAVKKVVDFTKKITLLASGLEESQNAVSVVFGQAANKLDAFGSTAVSAIGLTKAQFNELATTTGATLKASGQSIDTVADQTIELSKRAADTASIFNVDVKDSMAAFGSALRGEAEPARKFGINMTEAAVNAEAMASGLIKNKNEMTEQIKVQARYNLLMKQSSGYAGDFANTQDGFANQMKIAKVRMEENATIMGDAFLPLANVAVTMFNDLAENTTSTAEAIRDFTKSAEGASIIADVLGSLAGVVAVLKEGVTIVFDALKDAIDEIIQPFKELNIEAGDMSVVFDIIAGVFQFAASSIKLLGTSIGLLIRLFINLAEAVISSSDVVTAFIDRLQGKISKEEFKKKLDGAADAFKLFAEKSGKDIIVFTEKVTDEVTSFASRAEESAGDMRKAFEKESKEVTKTVKNALLTAGDNAEETGEKINEEIKPTKAKLAWDEFIKNTKDDLAGFVTQVGGMFGELFSNINSLQENQGNEELLNIQRQIDATEEGTDARIALEEEYAAREKQLSIEAAERQKKVALFNAGISTAGAIIGFLANPSGPAGVALSILAAATGAAQIAAIASTPAPYATGGIVPGTEYQGDRVPAMVNSGEMILNNQQQAQLFKQANGGGGGGQPINVYVGSKLIAQEVVDVINSGGAPIKANRGIVAR